MVLLVRQRSPARDVAGLIDSLIAALRLAVRAGRRGSVVRLLFLGTVAVPIAGAVYGWQILQGTHVQGSPLDGGWIAFYALFGAAALHPSARQFSQPQPAASPYPRERIPKALNRASDGLQRVSTIAGTMREFSHPPTTETAPANLSAAIENTLIVAANEYRHLAVLTTDLTDLPLVQCNIGDINHVDLRLPLARVDRAVVLAA